LGAAVLVAAFLVAVFLVAAALEVVLEVVFAGIGAPVWRDDRALPEDAVSRSFSFACRPRALAPAPPRPGTPLTAGRYRPTWGRIDGQFEPDRQHCPLWGIGYQRVLAANAGDFGRA
jgi:hypothetical protein